jgi:hypothetical protein
MSNPKSIGQRIDGTIAAVRKNLEPSRRALHYMGQALTGNLPRCQVLIHKTHCGKILTPRRKMCPVHRKEYRQAWKAYHLFKKVGPGHFTPIYDHMPVAVLAKVELWCRREFRSKFQLNHDPGHEWHERNILEPLLDPMPARVYDKERYHKFNYLDLELPDYLGTEIQRYPDLSYFKFKYEVERSKKNYTTWRRQLNWGRRSTKYWTWTGSLGDIRKASDDPNAPSYPWREVESEEDWS